MTSIPSRRDILRALTVSRFYKPAYRIYDVLYVFEKSLKDEIFVSFLTSLDRSEHAGNNYTDNS